MIEAVAARGHRPVLAPATMAEADRATIDAGTPGSVLMERAGTACAMDAIRLAGGIGGRRFLVLAGPGNNGGDGFVVARRLRERRAHVRCLLVGDRTRVRGDAALHLGLMETAGVRLEPAGPSAVLPRADVVVDALFGTGLRGGLRGDAAAVVERLGDAEGRPSVLAVDIPSGVDGTTGRVDGPAVRADRTVVIQAMKPGLVLGDGARHVGELVVVDVGIGIPSPPDVWHADPATALSEVPLRRHDAHKWQAAILIVGGSAGMSGAPGLVGRAAFSAGGALVVAAVPAVVQPLVAMAVPEMMTVRLPDDGTLVATGAYEALTASVELHRFGAVAVGPGFGRSGRVGDLVRAVLQSSARAVVLDADGLNAVGPEDLAGALAPVVVTPHDGELARLRWDPDAGANRIEAVAAAAEEWGVTVLAKGPATVVASPGRIPVVCTEGTRDLGTAGTGDVLTGTIAAYVARGAGLHEAAVAAACLHGIAGRSAVHSLDRTNDAEGRVSDVGFVRAGDVADKLGTAERRVRDGIEQE